MTYAYAGPHCKVPRRVTAAETDEGGEEGCEVEDRTERYRYDGCEAEVVAFVRLQRFVDVG